MCAAYMFMPAQAITATRTRGYIWKHVTSACLKLFSEVVEYPCTNVRSAAQLAMLILKNDGSALDAVEAAIKTLEDREITNAGYGSNLAMDGVVECDASVVDHYGRSGAVGAVARKSLTTKLMAKY